MLPADLSVLDDYTGASLFTVVSYLFFFYVLDAYNVGAEDFKDTTGRVLIAFFLGAIASASAFYAFQHWRFDRRTLLLFSLCLFSALAGVRSITSTSAALCIKPESCSSGPTVPGRYARPFPNP
ncbi:MAG: hypothetical protein ACLUPV_10705 [Bilophila wadsworthia]